MFVATILCIFLLVSLTSASDYMNSLGGVDCARVPPSMWCDSQKLASECGFTDLCEKYKTASKDKPVHLTLLYESLCPYCQKFIVETLPKIYTTFKDLLEIELVPYGNAKQINSTTIECQHGKKECDANKYESCAIHSLPEPVPFISCLEKLLEHGLEQAAKKCLAQLNVKADVQRQIQNCYNGTLGDQLQQQAGQRTDNVWPDRLNGVPWLIFNNVSMANQAPRWNEILPVAICQWFVADQVPDVCQNY